MLPQVVATTCGFDEDSSEIKHILESMLKEALAQKDKCQESLAAKNKEIVVLKALGERCADKEYSQCNCQIAFFREFSSEICAVKNSQ